jgi:hypothetical protein
MVKYINLEVSKAKMVSFKKTEKEIVLSVIENLICDAMIGAMNNDETNVDCPLMQNPHQDTGKGD